jgi:hypothetical protein
MTMKLGWKTIGGALLAGFGVISQPDVLAVLPHKWATVITAVGFVLSAFGIAHKQGRTNEKVDALAQQVGQPLQQPTDVQYPPPFPPSS